MSEEGAEDMEVEQEGTLGIRNEVGERVWFCGSFRGCRGVQGWDVWRHVQACAAGHIAADAYIGFACVDLRF